MTPASEPSNPKQWLHSSLCASGLRVRAVVGSGAWGVRAWKYWPADRAAMTALARDTTPKQAARLLSRVVRHSALESLLAHSPATLCCPAERAVGETPRYAALVERWRFV